MLMPTCKVRACVRYWIMDESRANPSALSDVQLLVDGAHTADHMIVDEPAGRRSTVGCPR